MLVACEYSGRVREAFRAKGHNAWSCDLLPSEDDSEFHFQCDIWQAVGAVPWDIMIAHPPCTYLTVSGLHWNKNNPERADKTTYALQFIRDLMATRIPVWAIENPVGCISTKIRKPNQIIQPYEFGEDASKKTCLWLNGLPKLVVDPSVRVPGRIVDGKERWANQTDSGQNKLAPSEDRWKERSRTYQGIANAMADQWG